MKDLTFQQEKTEVVKYVVVWTLLIYGICLAMGVFLNELVVGVLGVLGPIENVFFISLVLFIYPPVLAIWLIGMVLMILAYLILAKRR